MKERRAAERVDMFALPVAKPKVKTASNGKSALRPAVPLGQRHGDAEPAQMSPRLPQGDVSHAYCTAGQDSGPARGRADSRPPSRSWDFSNVPVYPPGRREMFFQMPPLFPAPRLPIQAKLDIGAVDDPLEREADRVADYVIRTPEPAPAMTSALPQVSRKCAECEQEQLKKKPVAESEVVAGEAPPIVHRVLSSPGQPLDPSSRAYFEPRFGHDFSKVRVHADTEAAQSAEAVQAQAYTVGREIVFGVGRYDPHSAGGRNLLAHELAHTIQQVGVPTGNQGRAVGQEPTMSKRRVSAPEKSKPVRTALQRQPKPDVKDKPRDVTPKSPSTSSANCRYSIKYTNPKPVDIADHWEKTTGNVSTNYLCGAVLMYDIVSVSATGKGCPKTLDGLNLTEDVKSEGTCKKEGVHWDVGSATFGPNGKCDNNCTDTFALLLDPEKPWPPNIHCKELATQKLFVGGEAAETHSITWHMDTDKAGRCTASVKRN
jgi:hypothetical protein